MHTFTFRPGVAPRNFFKAIGVPPEEIPRQPIPGFQHFFSSEAVQDVLQRYTSAKVPDEYANFSPVPGPKAAARRRVLWRAIKNLMRVPKRIDRETDELDSTVRMIGNFPPEAKLINFCHLALEFDNNFRMCPVVLFMMGRGFIVSNPKRYRMIIRAYICDVLLSDETIAKKTIKNGIMAPHEKIDPVLWAFWRKYDVASADAFMHKMYAKQTNFLPHLIKRTESKKTRRCIMKCLTPAEVQWSMCWQEYDYGVKPEIFEWIARAAGLSFARSPEEMLEQAFLETTTIGRIRLLREFIEEFTTHVFIISNHCRFRYKETLRRIRKLIDLTQCQEWDEFLDGTLTDAELETLPVALDATTRREARERAEQWLRENIIYKDADKTVIKIAECGLLCDLIPRVCSELGFEGQEIPHVWRIEKTALYCCPLFSPPLTERQRNFV